MRFILYIICVAYGLMAHAQNETTGFTSYETRQGLSNNAVLCLLQDSRNFLWIGTKEGLNRFDGHRFKKFFRQRNVSNGLASNYIFDILEYQYGQLLITTNNGISVLNTLTGQFENEKIKFAPLKPGSGTSVLSAFKATNGQIWISHNGEMDILDSTLKYLYRFTDIPWAKTLKGSLIFKDGYYDDQHRLWFPTDSSGIQIIDFAAKQVWNYKNNPLKLPFLNATKRYIRAFWVDEKNKALWYAPWGEGLSKYDFNTQLEQHQLFGLKGLLEFCTVDAIIQKNARRLICCVGDMICEVDINSLAYTKIIDKKIALVFIKTRDAQFWAGTPRGLLRLQDSPPYIRKLAFDGQEKVPALGECTSVAATKSGRLYVTYFNNALLQVEKDRETARFYKVNDNASIKLSSVCEDKSGRIWIGTSRGIFFFDSHSGKFLKPAWLPKALQASTINLVFCDRTGEVWIGTRNPFILFRYDPAQNQLQQITNNIVDRFTALYADSRISRIYEDKQNNLWMTSYLGGGIIQYNKASGEWKMWPQTTRHSNQLVNKGIIMLYPDDHNLWSIDYLGDGLNCYNYLTDSLTRFRREDGLASEYIKNFAADGNGNLWISNEFGLTKFNLKSHQTISYNLQNTLAANYENGENFFDTVTNSIVYPLS
ncbi:MAG: two-component regulator propeller domain-containing protein, partial [Ferruginibacter sp.]